MKKCLGSIFIILSLIGFFSGCPGSDDGDVDNDTPIANPSLSGDIQAIFNASCATSGCHNAAGAGGLVLSQGQSYANLVNKPSVVEPSFILVVPSDADNSYLVIKLEGRQTIGSRMPPSGSLGTVSIQNIKNWINNGAPNN